MASNTAPAGQSPQSAGQAAGAVSAVNAVIDELDRQRLRILRCTAQAMACSPGGLRFKPGTRPWLEGLSASFSANSRLNEPASQPATH